MNWSSLIAIIGAIGAAFANGWNIIRDRRKLLVEAFFGEAFFPSGEKKDVFYMVITNMGRRPIYISKIGGSYKKNSKFFDIIPRFPQKLLKESESYTEYTEDIDKLINKIDNIKNIFAIDSLKKKWKISCKYMHQLKEDAIKIKDKIEQNATKTRRTNKK